jgi:hypothetical protein
VWSCELKNQKHVLSLIDSGENSKLMKRTLFNIVFVDYGKCQRSHTSQTKLKVKRNPENYQNTSAVSKGSHTEVRKEDVNVDVFTE